MAVASLKRAEVAAHASTGGLPRVRKPTGAEKAAILFLCLGEKRGSQLMQKLDTEEIQKVTRAMSGLGAISAETVEMVLTGFTEEMANGGGVVGSFAVAESLLRSLLPENQVDGILKDIRGPLKEKDLWARFSGLSENVIANYLKNEHEQTIAVILSNVKNDVTAKVLPLLGTEKMENVIERMIKMESVPHHMMKQIEETLSADIVNASSQPTASEMHQKMADLFNKLDPNALEAVSPGLETRLNDTFNSIKQKMFTFEDLSRLTVMDLAKIMRGAPGNTLPVALRGASEETRAVFLNALPGRSRDMLEEEMETMGAVRRREVQEAQAFMLDYAKQLADEDQIKLPLGDDEDELF
ncbi:flagellar motor protein [Oceanicola sp. 22II-s10i]|uniref:flagellar motor switch protein FliG n=1 Tax=Oceanicola sp. 22II-s10i TaxID=1317116 RepID=UPI000B522BC3|nr:flagellar motor switch protein FliG [Oceanicola sp. 22II-s10i]OWU83200.1 flagellar motor protein [Oceanicola sp. 22II-s10i]